MEMGVREIPESVDLYHKIKNKTGKKPEFDFTQNPEIEKIYTSIIYSLNNIY